MIGPFGHLGAEASALADGSLDAAQAARARAHAAECEACARAVRDLRRQRRLTGSLADVEVPTTLQERILAMAEAGDDSEARAASGDGFSRAPWADEVRPARHRSARVLAVATASVLGVGIAASGSLMVIGSSRTTPAASLTALGAAGPAAQPSSALSTITVAAFDETTWPDGWTPPASLPSTTQVRAVQELDSGELRVDLEVAGSPVTVLESHGVLDLSGVEVARSVLVGEVEAHLVGDWWLAQTGSEVVAVTADDEQLGLDVIREFEDAGSETVLDTVARGWRVIAGD